MEVEQAAATQAAGTTEGKGASAISAELQQSIFALASIIDPRHAGEVQGPLLAAIAGVSMHVLKALLPPILRASNEAIMKGMAPQLVQAMDQRTKVIVEKSVVAGIQAGMASLQAA